MAQLIRGREGMGGGTAGPLLCADSWDAPSSGGAPHSDCDAMARAVFKKLAAGFGGGG
jgi:hypothetical protein